MLVSADTNHWPQYASPLEALQKETTGRWSPTRLAEAQERYGELDGRLPATVTKLGICAIDVAEPADQFALLDLYGRQPINYATFGALLLVNYQGTKPTAQVEELVAAIQEQRARNPHVLSALAIVGYPGLPEPAFDVKLDATRKHAPQKTLGALDA